MKHYSRGFVLTKGVLLAGLCAGLFTSFFAWNKLTLARDGKTQYTIVYADQATGPEKFALRELTNFLGRVTGASFPVAAESSLLRQFRFMKQTLSQVKRCDRWVDILLTQTGLSNPRPWLVKHPTDFK